MTQTEEAKLVEPLRSRQEIERQAIQILQERGLYSIPVTPLSVARREGISVSNVRFKDDSLAGAVIRKMGQMQIYLNENDSPARKRFTLAHELGHFFLHLRHDGSFADGADNMFRHLKRDQPATRESRREYQANLFAAALLMPEEKVRSYWQSTDSIDELARFFSVSDLAMSVRLGQLGLLDDSAN